MDLIYKISERSLNKIRYEFFELYRKKHRLKEIKFMPKHRRTIILCLSGLIQKGIFVERELSKLQSIHKSLLHSEIISQYTTAKRISHTETKNFHQKSRITVTLIEVFSWKVVV